MTEEIRNIEQESNEIVARAESYSITNQLEFEAAGEMLTGMVKDLKTKIKDSYDPLIKKAHEAHKAICAEKKKQLEPVEKAESILKKKINDYYQEKKRLERIEQERLDKEAKDKEEKERNKILKKAAKEEEKGNSEKADDLLEKADNVTVLPTATAPKVEKVAGISIKENWTFRIVDQDKLIQAALQNPFLKRIVTIDEKELRKIVKQQKDNLKIDGLKVWDAGSVAA